MKTLIGAALAALYLAAGAETAEAKVIPEVRQFMTTEIGKQAHAARLGTPGGSEQRLMFAPAAESSYSLATFALRVRGEIGFDVGGFANIKVVPLAEFFWM